MCGTVTIFKKPKWSNHGLKKQIKFKEKKNKRNVEMNLIFKLIVGSKC